MLLYLLLIFSSFTIFSQAKLDITDDKKNFGFVKRGETVKNEYEIINTGKSPLYISDVEISCSCTTADFSTKPILPGQKATVIIIFNSTTTYGRQDRVVYVHSNDPKSPHKLRYKGIVSQQ